MWIFLRKQTGTPAVRPVRAEYDKPLRRTGRHQSTHHTTYVPSFFCHTFTGAGCGHPVYPANARTQLDQHDGDLYACIERETEGYSGA